MKKLIVALATLILILSVFAGCSSGSDTEAADDFTATTLDGRTVSLSDYSGQVVVVNFWGIWCPYCVDEMPDFYKVTQQYPEVVFLMVNTSNTLGHEDPQDIRDFMDENKISFENVLLNENVAQTYGVRNFPSTYVIDAQGNIVQSVRGGIDQSYLIMMIETAKESK